MDPPAGPQRRPGPAGRRPRYAPLPDLAHPRPARTPRPAADPPYQPQLAMDGRVPGLLAALADPASTRLTSTNQPSDTKGDPARRGRSRCALGHTVCRRLPPPP